MRLISAGSGVQVPAPPPFPSHSDVQSRRCKLIPGSCLAVRACTFIMILADRVLGRSQARACWPPADACARRAVRRPRFGRAAAPAARELETARRADRRRGWRISTISCAARTRTRRGFCRALAAALGLPLEVGRADVRARGARATGARSRMPPARRATRFFERGRADARGRRDCGWPQPRRPGGDVPAAADQGRRAPRARRRSCRAPAASIRPLLDIARADLRAYAARSSASVQERRDQRRSRDPAEPRPARAHALPRAGIFARDRRGAGP